MANDSWAALGCCQRKKSFACNQISERTQQPYEDWLHGWENQALSCSRSSLFAHASAPSNNYTAMPSRSEALGVSQWLTLWASCCIIISDANSFPANASPVSKRKQLPSLSKHLGSCQASVIAEIAFVDFPQP